MYYSYENQQYTQERSAEIRKYLILNKLCFDNQIFLIKDNDLQNFRTEPLEVKDQADEKYDDETIDPSKSKNCFAQMFDSNFIFDKNSNLSVVFIKLFCILIILYLIFGGLVGILIMIMILADRSAPGFVKVFLFYFGLYFIFGSSFFWTYVGYGQMEDEKNIKFYGINALTLTECIYFNLFLVGIFFLTLYITGSHTAGNMAYNEIEVRSDQLYFETIDRSDLSNYMVDCHGGTTLYSFVRDEIQPISQVTSNMTQNENIPKIWNSGYILMKQIQNKKASKSYQLIILYGFLGIIFLSIHITLPIYYLHDHCKDDFDRWNLAIIIIVNVLYACSFMLNLILQSYSYIGFENIETLTSLLEIKSNPKSYQFKKMVPSLNIYCIQSIKTWFNIRLLMLIVNQRFFRFVNILQTIEVITFLTLSTILLMDYFGAGWKKNQISDNELLFGLMLSNILSRLVLNIIPLFLTFSYINSLLLQNKEQIYSLISKLQNISHNYKLYREDYSEKINKLQSELQNSDLIQKERARQSTVKRDQIEQLRAIFEIIRNAQLYSGKQCNQESKIDSSESNINCEIDYLSKLIQAYKIIYKDMKVYENKHLLSFLGIFPISYAKAQAVAVIAIPALLSLIFQRINSKIY